MAPSRPPTRLFRPSRPLCPAVPSFATVARLLPPLLLGAALLWPGQAGAADNLERTPGLADPGAWNTPDGWTVNKGARTGSKVNSAGGGVDAGDIVWLNASTTASTLDLGGADHSIRNLNVDAGGWGIKNGTLQTNTFKVTAAGGTFTIDNAELNVTNRSDGPAGNANIIADTFTLVNKAILRSQILSVQGNYADDQDSIVTVAGRSSFGRNNAATPSSSVIRGNFTTNGLTVYNNADVTLEATARMDTGTESNTIANTLTLAGTAPDPDAGTPGTGAQVTGTGHTDVVNGGMLKLDGASSYTGGSLTVADGGTFTDNAHSKVTLTGDAKFNTHTTINGAFGTGGKVDIFGDGTIGNKSADFGFASNGLRVTGALTLNEGASASYGDTADIYWGLTLKEGSKLWGDDLAVGNNIADGNRHLTMADNSELQARNISVSNNVDLTGKEEGVTAGNSLSAASLRVGGTYTDAANSKVSIGGLADFQGDATVSSTDFIAGSLATAASAKLTLTPNAHVTLNAQNYESVLNGALELGDGSTLDSTNGAGIRFDGTGSTYTDTAGSTVNLDGKAVFANGQLDNTIKGNFSANGMDIRDGSAVRTEHNIAGDQKFDLKEGDLTLAGSVSDVSKNTLDAGSHTLDLSTVTLGAYSELKGGALTVHDTYTDVANSKVDVTGVARFANSPTDADPSARRKNEIKGTFSAQVMEIDGRNIDVTADTATTFDITDLKISGGNNTLNAGARDLTLRNVVLGADGTLTAGSITLGNGSNSAMLRMERNSQVHAATGDITLKPGATLDIDLNREQNNPALKAGGNIVFNNNALSLRHSGDVAQDGPWTLMEAGAGGADGKVINGGYTTAIDTASLHGVVNLVNSNKQLVFAGAYTPMTNANLALLAATRPNARRAAAGFADAFNNRRTPFMNTMDAAYGSMGALEADVARNLQDMTAEAAVTHAAQTQRAHIDIANAALGYALGADAPLSAQGFVPNLHASLMQMGQQANPFQDQQQRNFLASRQRVSLSVRTASWPGSNSTACSATGSPLRSGRGSSSPIPRPSRAWRPAMPTSPASRSGAAMWPQRSSSRKKTAMRATASIKTASSWAAPWTSCPR